MSAPDERSQHRDDVAASWAIKLDAGPLARADAQALERWLAGDPRAEGALLRARAALAFLDRGRALGDLGPISDDAGGAAANDRADDERSPPGGIGRRGLMASGLAAAAVATIGGIAVTRDRRERLATAVGEIRQVPLADGSRATINTASELSVEMAKDRRTVALARGEAWFSVMPDKSRPFIVEAGEVRVRAVGTAFSVRRLDMGADVLVTEGVVETWIVGRESERRRIAAGGRGMVAVDQAAIAVADMPQAVDRVLAWRTGELALDGETLGYAVEEINRYNDRKLVIDDPELAREQLVGYFRTGEPARFAQAVAPMVDARVETEGNVIRLVRRGP